MIGFETFSIKPYFSKNKLYIINKDSFNTIVTTKIIFALFFTDKIQVSFQKIQLFCGLCDLLKNIKNLEKKQQVKIILLEKNDVVGIVSVSHHFIVVSSCFYQSIQNISNPA